MSLREIANLLKLCGFGGFAKNKRILSSHDSALLNQGNKFLHFKVKSLFLKKKPTP